MLLVGCGQNPFAERCVIEGVERAERDVCECERVADVARVGVPEDVNTYVSDAYVSIGYWWWSQGYQRGYAYGSLVDGCSVTTYTFTPIR